MWRNILLNNLGFQRDILRFLIKPPENEKVRNGWCVMQFNSYGVPLYLSICISDSTCDIFGFYFLFFCLYRLLHND